MYHICYVTCIPRCRNVSRFVMVCWQWFNRSTGNIQLPQDQGGNYEWYRKINKINPCANVAGYNSVGRRYNSPDSKFMGLWYVPWQLHKVLVCFVSLHGRDMWCLLWGMLRKFDQVTVHVHYTDVMMTAVASQITGVLIVCSTVCSGLDQRKHQSSASLAFVRGIHRWPMDSPHNGPVTRKTFPFNDVIMVSRHPLTPAPYLPRDPSVALH